MRLLALTVLAVTSVFGLCACERESRPIDKLPGATSQADTLSDLHAGPAPATSDISPFQQNAWGMAEGKRLFTAYNCTGCHSNGGGGMGPALMDDEWIYGSHPRNIFAAIVEGRPNGMPAWQGKIPDAQVWQLVAYIQSMSGQRRKPPCRAAAITCARLHRKTIVRPRRRPRPGGHDSTGSSALVFSRGRQRRL